MGENGGWLLIGTGERGKDTLGGFDSSFMEVSCKSVSKVGEEMMHRKKCSNWEVIPDLPGLIFTDAGCKSAAEQYKCK